jgi:hypothetical protein
LNKPYKSKRSPDHHFHILDFNGGFTSTAGARDLIGKLLQKKPEERLPLDKVVMHPWVLANAAQ